MSLASHFLDELFSHSRALSIERNERFPTKIRPSLYVVTSIFVRFLRSQCSAPCFIHRSAIRETEDAETSQPDREKKNPTALKVLSLFFYKSTLIATFFMSTDPTAVYTVVQFPHQTESILGYILGLYGLDRHFRLFVCLFLPHQRPTNATRD